jgi:hypothetical protein
MSCKGKAVSPLWVVRYSLFAPVPVVRVIE